MSYSREKMDRVFRERQKLSSKYSLENQGNLFNFTLLRDHIAERLASVFENLENVRMLDLGAGELFWVEQFVKMGLRPEHCIGSDLLLWRLKNGRADGREAVSVAASAAELPFAENSFDIVTQFVMMTSVPDDRLRRQIASEMKRVLRPGGYILWHDFRFNNPSNPHTRAIGKRELYGFFEGWPIACEKITLLPPLARKLGGKLSPLLNFFHTLPILRTHYLALIGPKG